MALVLGNDGILCGIYLHPASGVLAVSMIFSHGNKVMESVAG